MEASQKYVQVYKEVFLFINSGSGSGLGKQMIEMCPKSPLKFDVPKTQQPLDQKTLVKVNIHLYNLRDPESKKVGFQKIKQQLGKIKSEPILAICGGDGTIMRVFQDMMQAEIAHQRVLITIIPLGTGNDFSQTLGWGNVSPDLLSNDFQNLKKRVTDWMSAKEEKLDIWMIKAEAQEYGKFQYVQDGKNKVLNSKQLTRHFCNYFSVGVDAKVGYSFDMHRTSCRMGNIAVYGVLGFLKSFTKTKNIGQLTESLRESKNSLSNEGESQQFNKPILEQESPNFQAIKSNENLLALNINSFMGGVVDVWKNAKLKPHLKDVPFTESSLSDGKLDFVSFGGVWSLGLEKTAGGISEKVHQGSGPFQLIFNKYPPEEKHRTYLQIDGQFIRFTHPKRLFIRKSKFFQKNQIRVLRRVPLENQKGCCGCQE